jgi:hypothetical protein
MFVVYQEPEGKSHMLFKMHKRRLHHFAARYKENLTFVNIVSKKKEKITKRQSKDVEAIVYSMLSDRQ